MQKPEAEFLTAGNREICENRTGETADSDGTNIAKNEARNTQNMKLICYFSIALVCAELNAGEGTQNPNAAAKPARTIHGSSDLKLRELNPVTPDTRFIRSNGKYDRPDLLKTAMKLCSSGERNNGGTSHAA